VLLVVVAFVVMEMNSKKRAQEALAARGTCSETGPSITT